MKSVARNFTLFGLFLLLVGGISLTGCGEDTDPEAGFDNGVARDTSGSVTLTAGKHGPAFDELSFDVLTPGEGEVLSGDSIDITVSIAGLELMAPTQGEGANSLAYSKDGQHIHVIINNQPYMAKYDTTFTIAPLASGEHALVAFPSRSWHESVKTPGAVVARRFYHGSTEASGFDPSSPALVYSRPKGEYVGEDAARVMLDFYLLNVDLSPDGYRVVATVDGKVLDTISAWVPHFIEGLEDGKHSIGLSLIDAEGNSVENGPYGTIEREITISPAPDEDSTDGDSDEDDDHDHQLEEDVMDIGTVTQGL